jgi:hypothetical protein
MPNQNAKQMAGHKHARKTNNNHSPQGLKFLGQGFPRGFGNLFR